MHDADPLLALVNQAARLLLDRRLTLSLAESSTGGALADALCAPPGASAYFLGGVVAYSNPSKVALLGVPAALLERHGAVSPEAAEAMALGARRAFGSHLGLAVTGILGPGGGTPEKPVGLTFIALAGPSALIGPSAPAGLSAPIGPSALRQTRHQFTGHRAQIKAASVEAALRLLLSTP